MFESAELDHTVSKTTYIHQVPELRQALLDAQVELREKAKFPVIILIGGVEGAGRGESVKILNEWMDPRFIETHALGTPTEEELAHPPMWRFWKALPPKGKIGILFGSWYTMPIINRVYDRTKNAEMDQAMERIVRFEQMLHEEGAVILKFWLHLSKERQKKRLKKLEKDPDTRWRVTEQDWKNFKRYDKYQAVSERALRLTSSGVAPWIVVEGTDSRYRHLTVGETLLHALRKRLDIPAPAAPTSTSLILPPIDNRFLLQSLDFSQTLSKEDFGKELAKYQRQLNLLIRRSKFKQTSVILVFEGSDAAGKGGGIRRIAEALDPRNYRIVPIASPTEDEKAQPYLWRFWRHIPRKGNFTIFDRSWYGRVLVERVEGFCQENDWMRAYSEINDFEEQLIQSGAIVIKFWLSITKAEQLKRFKEREKTPFKRFKITADDWRNREKWHDYEIAVSEMIDRTSTEIAPWTVVEANNKYFARIKILKTLCAGIEQAL